MGKELEEQKKVLQKAMKRLGYSSIDEMFISIKRDRIKAELNELYSWADENLNSFSKGYILYKIKQISDINDK